MENALSEPASSHAERSLNKRFHHHLYFPLCLGLIDNAHGAARGKGTCGDVIEMNLRLNGERIEAIGFRFQGCSYTAACASAVTTLAKGKSVEDALKLQPEDVGEELGGLPEDHMHCARLAVNTLGEAIEAAYGAVAGSKKKKE